MMTGMSGTSGDVPPVADNPCRRPGQGRVIHSHERAGRHELQAVSGDDLLRMWEDAVAQIRGVVPVLAHTVDELQRHVQDKRTAEELFTQHTDVNGVERDGGEGASQ